MYVNTGDRIMILAFFNFPYSSPSVYKVSLNYLQYFQRCAPDKLIFAKIKKENNSVIICDKVMVLAFCTFYDNLLSMDQVSFNSILYLQRYAPYKLFFAKIKQESNFVNTSYRIMNLVFSNFPYSHLSAYQVS